MKALVDACGIVGSGIALVMFVPQAARCWRFRRIPESLAGVSYVGMVLLLGNALAWAVYGIGSGAYWTAVPSALNGPLAVSVLWILAGNRHAPIDSQLSIPPRPRGIDRRRQAAQNKAVCPVAHTPRTPH